MTHRFELTAGKPNRNETVCLIYLCNTLHGFGKNGTKCYLYMFIMSILLINIYVITYKILYGITYNILYGITYNILYYHNIICMI